MRLKGIKPSEEGDSNLDTDMFLETQYRSLGTDHSNEPIYISDNFKTQKHFDFKDPDRNNKQVKRKNSLKLIELMEKDVITE
eukprot:CAMPEP_0170565858 /NCGR_PEP_ID=MMETSP0211-20121228/79453_1 /TAXON_ID=311385 /ORGANISM="Pseudokeronopsis sp., Strain OXSARD2" /LENGTH=81 /DNA_ID=CAMNT_0010886843 /DNA_START=1913 /DNA_END=2158 /DNA_ORIENTATION=-